MSRLIWIYAVCKSLLLSPMAVKELNTLRGYTQAYKDNRSICFLRAGFTSRLYIRSNKNLWIICGFQFKMVVCKIQCFSYWPFQGDSSVAVLFCLCVCGFICGVCFVLICSSSLLLLVPREGISWGIFTYICSLRRLCCLPFWLLRTLKCCTVVFLRNCENNETVITMKIIKP